MELLSRQMVKDGLIPAGVRADLFDHLPVRAVQMGEGNFLRAFTCWMINEMNARGVFNGSIAVIQPRPGGRIEDLKKQDCLYTLLTRGLSGGRLVDEKEIISSISAAVDPYKNWNAYCALARTETVRLFISNTTESGIVYSYEKKPEGASPLSFPAKAAAFLYERFTAFNGSPDRGLIFLPCELIDTNGTVLKEIILRHAQDWNLGDSFSAWVNTHNIFLNTLVDRIVPGYPKDEADAIEKTLGYKDVYLDAAEAYHVWVLEGDGSLHEELPFAEAGLNVLWTENLSVYRTRKVKVLNGLHTMSVLASFLAGNDTVRESIEHPVIGEYMRKGVFNEILPTIDMDAQERRQFAEEVLERFRNPFMKHYCLSIALNSVSKFKVRVLPSILDYYAMNGTAPRILSFSLAALIAFYRIDAIEGETFSGSRDGRPYPVKDDAAICRFFADAWHAFSISHSTQVLVKNILSQYACWGTDLSLNTSLMRAVTVSLDDILQYGMIEAVKLSTAEY